MTEITSKNNSNHNIVPLALRSLKRLCLQIPPEGLFEQLFGYDGDRRFVAFYYAATNLCYDDGQACGAGSYWPYGTWLQHPSVRSTLAEYNLGYDDQDYEHWLVLDRVHRRLYAGPWREAAHVVQRQDGVPNTTPPLQLSFEELQEIAERIHEFMPPVPSMPEIQRRHKEQQAKTQELVAWLEKWVA